MPSTTPLRVYLEGGAKKTFAAALDWPGWSRAAKDEARAIEALEAYLPRYAPVVEAAGLSLPDARDFDVVERVTGSATTDFGALTGAADKVPDADHAPLAPGEADRLAALFDGAWQVFDDVVAASPPELRKGPRGGGRDRDKMVDHVHASTAMDARKLGVRHKPPAPGDRDAVSALRRATVEAIRDADDPGAALSEGWPVRTSVRRIAWHLLDHAWEMEDRRS